MTIDTILLLVIACLLFEQRLLRSNRYQNRLKRFYNWRQRRKK